MKHLFLFILCILFFLPVYCNYGFVLATNYTYNFNYTVNYFFNQTIDYGIVIQFFSDLIYYSLQFKDVVYVWYNPNQDTDNGGGFNISSNIVFGEFSGLPTGTINILNYVFMVFGLISLFVAPSFAPFVFLLLIPPYQYIYAVLLVVFGVYRLWKNVKGDGGEV